MAGGQTNFRGSLSALEVLAALGQADLLVVPSRKEGVQLADGIPTVISEAMSQGVPVLATAVGGIPRVFAGRDPGPGWLVEPDSVSSLVKGLELVRGSDLSRAAASATRSYRELLSPHMVLGAYEEQYRLYLRRWRGR